MGKCNLSRHQAGTNNLALENCCTSQVIQSMFEEVACQDAENLAFRADRGEIAKFSQALVEHELIFGSPSEDVLRSIQQKIRDDSQSQSKA